MIKITKPADFNIVLLLQFLFLILPKEVSSQNSVLSSGNWYKFGVKEYGIYFLTRSDLSAAGINAAATDPRNISIFGNPAGMLPINNNVTHLNDLQEMTIMVKGEADGIFDPWDTIFFYGQSQTQWKPDSLQSSYHHITNIYSDSVFYFLTVLNHPGKRMQSVQSLSSNTIITSTFTDYAFHEKDSMNFLESGKKWYGDQFDPLTHSSKVFSFDVNQIASNESLFFRTYLLARSSFTDSSEFVLGCNNAYASVKIKGTNNQFFDSAALYRNVNLIVPPPINNGDLYFNFSCADTSANGWIDYIELNFIRNLSVYRPWFNFREARNNGTGVIKGYTVSNASSTAFIFDVTDPVNVFIQEYTVNGSTIQFNAAGDVTHEYLYFSPGSSMAASSLFLIDNQNLQAQTYSQMLIITGDQFESQANTLASFHQSHDGISCLVTPISKIYNEYSSGSKDPVGIRDYIRKLFHNSVLANDSLKYLLLFGGGDFDYRNRTQQSHDLVPTYQTDQSLILISSFCTDDFYGYLGEGASDKYTDTVQIAIGRIPAIDSTDANVINKIMSYDDPSNFGGWRTRIIAVADDQDHNTHFTQMETIMDTIESATCNFNLRKIYLDAYVQILDTAGQRYPGAKSDIITNIEQGCLAVEFIGHGSALGWANERVLDSLSFTGFNTNRHPLYIAMTADWNKFDRPGYRSCGQIVSLSESSTGIASIGATRIGFSSINFNFNKWLHKYLLQKQNGLPMRIGDVLKKTKQSVFDPNLIPFCLLGDPAIRLNVPVNDVVLTTINGWPVSAMTDTLIPGQTVTIEGQIEDLNGSVINGFNGTVEITLYDQATLHYTLANDTSSGDISIAAPYYQFDDTLYNRIVTVVNGLFADTFSLAFDVDSGIGVGRFNFYAHSSNEDAMGCSSGPVYRNLTPGINELDEKTSVVISPNPADDQFNVEINNPSHKKMSFSMFSSKGEKLMDIPVRSSRFIVHRGSAAPGIYFYRLTDSDKKILESGKVVFR